MMPRRSALSLIALGAAALAVPGCASWRAERAEAESPPSGRFVEALGVPVHYVRAGSGPEVVLIHGAGGNLRDFTFDLMGRLTDRYTVTAFDRPGLGYTGRHPAVATGPAATDGESPAQQAELLMRAAERLGIRAPIVAGHSFGGIVAYAWALAGLTGDSPADAAGVLGLAGVTLPWPGELGPYYRINGSAFGGAVAVPLIGALVPEGVVKDRIERTFAPQPAPEGYAEHIAPRLTLRPASFRANIRQVNTLRPHVVEMERRYPEIAIPVEMVHGTADRTVPIEVHARPAAERHGWRLTELPGVGHMPHHVDPAATVAALDRLAAAARLRDAS